MTIVSFRHQFIFVKTRKTGGTSIEVELSQRIEHEAIVTPILPPEPGHNPRNFRRGLFRKDYFNHMPARDIRAFLGKAQFDGMYKVCVEREPVSKCISHFHMLRNSSDHRHKGAQDMSWEAYCEVGDFPIDLDIYGEARGKRHVLLVDGVIPYETLEEGLSEACSHVGIEPFRIEARAKSGYSAKKLVRTEDVTDEQRIRIYDAFEASLICAGLLEHYAARVG